MKKYRIALTGSFLLVGLLTAGVAAAVEHAMDEGHISMMPSELNWVDAPSVGKGAKIAGIDNGNMQTGMPFTFRLKLPPHFRMGVHTHPGLEVVTVLVGTFNLGIGDQFDQSKARAYAPGGITSMPPGMPMFAFTGDEETIIQIHGVGARGTKFLYPEDDPTKK